MKINVTNENTMFNPVTISITCETKEELFALWHRFNLHNFDVEKNSSQPDQSEVPDYGWINTNLIWKEIDDLCRKWI